MVLVWQGERARTIQHIHVVGLSEVLVLQVVCQAAQCDPPPARGMAFVRASFAARQDDLCESWPSTLCTSTARMAAKGYGLSWSM